MSHHHRPPLTATALHRAAVPRPPAGPWRPGRLAWSLALALACQVLPVQAQVTGAQAVLGTVQLSTQDNRTLITTTNGAGTQHSVVNWQSFSIPSGSSAYIAQPSSDSTSVNRVVTANPTSIYGTLGSNGQVILINPAGITVGAGAVVDTAGFTASTLALSEAQAKAGQWQLGDGSASTGQIQIDGQVIARGGSVVLVAPRIATGQDALIQAADGSVILAAGQQAEIVSRDLAGVRLLVQAPTDQVVNLGQLSGNAVGLFASQLRHSGQIDVQAVTTDGGQVELRANRLTQEGVIRARGAGSAVRIAALTDTQRITLGGADDGQSLHLSQAGLGRISANTLAIGLSESSGGLHIQGPITLDSDQVTALSLTQNATGRITQAADAPLSVSHLHADAGTVALEADNRVDVISGRAYQAGGFSLTSAQSALEIGTVNGVSGIVSGTENAPAAIQLRLTAAQAKLTQASGVKLRGGSVVLNGPDSGSSSVTLGDVSASTRLDFLNWGSVFLNGMTEFNTINFTTGNRLIYVTPTGVLSPGGRAYINPDAVINADVYMQNMAGLSLGIESLDRYDAIRINGTLSYSTKPPLLYLDLYTPTGAPIPEGTYAFLNPVTPPSTDTVNADVLALILGGEQAPALTPSGSANATDDTSSSNSSTDTSSSTSSTTESTTDGSAGSSTEGSEGKSSSSTAPQTKARKNKPTIYTDEQSCRR